MKVFILSLIAIFFIASLVTEASAGAVCKSTGDPHYWTFKRHRANLYGRKGDFLLAKDDKGELIVQTRIQYGKYWRNKGLNTAVAVKVGNDVVEHFGHFYKVNGQKNGKLEFSGKGSIHRHGNRWIVKSGNGEKVEFHRAHINNRGDKRWPDYYFNVYVRVPSRNRGKMSGLCGTYESRGKDRQLWKKPDIYRVKPDSVHNIFDIKYKGSEGSRKKHLNIKWPNKHMKRKAQKFCKKQRLTSDLYDDCVYDIKVSGRFQISKHYKEVRQDLRELQSDSGCSRLAKKKRAYQKLVNRYKQLHRQHEKKADKHEKKLNGHHQKLKGHALKRAQYLKQYKKYLKKSNQQKQKAKQFKKKASHHHGKYRHHLNKSKHYNNKAQQSKQNRQKYKNQMNQHLKNAEHHQNRKQYYDKKYEEAKAKYNKFMHLVKFYRRGVKHAPTPFHKSYFTNRYNHFKRLADTAQDKYERHLGLKRKYDQLYDREKKRANNDQQNMKQAANNIKKYSQKASNHAKAASRYHSRYRHHLSTANKFLKMADKNEEKSDWKLKKADDQLRKIKLTRRTKTMLKRQHLITSKKAQEYEDRVDKYKEKADKAADKLKKCRHCIRTKENKMKQLKREMNRLMRQYRQKKKQVQKVKESKDNCGPDRNPGLTKKCTHFRRYLNRRHGGTRSANRNWRAQCPGNRLVTALWDDNNKFSDLDDMKCCKLAGGAKVNRGKCVALNNHRRNGGTRNTNRKWKLQCPTNYAITGFWDDNDHFRDIDRTKCCKLENVKIDYKNCKRVSHLNGKDGGTRNPNKKWRAQCPSNHALVGMWDSNNFGDIDYMKCCPLVG